MPPLAERKKKVKWVNLGRQALWKEGSTASKFGKELMEKMGWKIGQGLGVNKQGITTPLKVDIKHDRKGIGHDDDDSWIEQQCYFNEFLGTLSSTIIPKDGEYTEERKSVAQSLEEKSKQSKSRVHYQKFTRGKDLSRYSKKDLECILGSNLIDSSKAMVVDNDRDVDNAVTGLNTKNSGSMVDYFAKKMKNRLKGANDTSHETGDAIIMENHSNHSIDCDSQKESPEHFNASESLSIEVNECNDGKIMMDVSKKLKKKSKRKKFDTENSSGHNDSEEVVDSVESVYREKEGDIVQEDATYTLSKKKKKKKHKDVESSEEFHGNEDCILPNESIMEHVKKKKCYKEDDMMKNLRLIDTCTSDTKSETCPKDETVIDCDSYVKDKKKKKKRKRSECVDIVSDGKEMKSPEDGLDSNCVRENKLKLPIKVNENSVDVDAGRNTFKSDKKAVHRDISRKQENNSNEDSFRYKQELTRVKWKIDSKHQKENLKLFHSINTENFKGSNLGILKGYGTVEGRKQNDR